MMVAPPIRFFTLENVPEKGFFDLSSITIKI